MWEPGPPAMSSPPAASPLLSRSAYMWEPRPRGDRPPPSGGASRPSGARPYAVRRWPPPPADLHPLPADSPGGRHHVPPCCHLRRAGGRRSAAVAGGQGRTPCLSNHPPMAQSNALLCIGLLALGGLLAAPRGGELRPTAEPTPWLTLGNTRGPSAPETLTVSADGLARVHCETALRSRYIGSFEMKLSPPRLAALREAVARARVEEMKDDYPTSSDDADYGLVDLTV